MVQLDRWTISTGKRTAGGTVKRGFFYAVGPFAAANAIGSVTEHAIWEHMVTHLREGDGMT